MQGLPFISKFSSQFGGIKRFGKDILTINTSHCFYLRALTTYIRVEIQEGCYDVELSQVH